MRRVQNSCPFGPLWLQGHGIPHVNVIICSVDRCPCHDTVQQGAKPQREPCSSRSVPSGLVPAIHPGVSAELVQWLMPSAQEEPSGSGRREEEGGRDSYQ